MKMFFHQHAALYLAGFLSTCAYVFLALNSQYYGDAGLDELFIVAIVCGVLCVAVWLRYWRANQQPPMIIILVFALLFRLIGVTTFPVLEDDFYRYLWDGRLAVELGSPYGHVPATFFTATDLSLRFESILGLINYPDIATVYGPVCQWVFALAYLIAPGEVWPLQLFFAVVDVALILLLFKMAQPLAVLLYAWSPLVIKEFAVTAHPDVLGAALLLAGYYAYQRRCFVLLGCLLALASGVKVFALLLVPLLLGWQWRAWLAFVVTACVIAWPWGIVDAWLPAGLQAMGDAWLFNAPIYLLLEPWVSITAIKLVLLLLLVSVGVVYYVYAMRRWPLPVIRGDYLFAALLLCAPAMNAWYLVWLLPFAVLFPSLWAWVASFTVFLAYASGLNLSLASLSDPLLAIPPLQSYEIPKWIVFIEFALIACAALLQPYLAARLRGARRTSVDRGKG